MRNIIDLLEHDITFINFPFSSSRSDEFIIIILRRHYVVFTSYKNKKIFHSGVLEYSLYRPGEIQFSHRFFFHDRIWLFGGYTLCAYIYVIKVRRIFQLTYSYSPTTQLVWLVQCTNNISNPGTQRRFPSQNCQSFSGPLMHSSYSPNCLVASLSPTGNVTVLLFSVLMLCIYNYILDEFCEGMNQNSRYFVGTEESLTFHHFSAAFTYSCLFLSSFFLLILHNPHQLYDFLLNLLILYF